ncbi:MAG: rhomboid family intramembrane serine protease [Puniceicoccales bacterium]
MLKCPDCRITLNRIKTEEGLIWRCQRCAGTAVLMPVLRKFVPAQHLNRLWQRTRQHDLPKIRDCPGCRSRMEEVLFETQSGDRILDVCESCQFVWIDHEEWGDIPRKAKAVRPKTLKDLPMSDALREKVASHQIEHIRKKHELEFPDEKSPEQAWQWIPAIAGLPIEEAQPTRSRFAIATYLTFFLILSASLYAFSHPSAIQESGLIPADWSRGGGITLISSFFLQTGFLPLILNLYFFVTFADNVEHLLGPPRFVILLLLSILCGGVAHVLTHTDVFLPTVGASGGISGVIAFYGLSFPRSRLFLLTSRHRWWSLFQKNKFIQVNAAWLLVIWFFLQFCISFSSGHGGNNPSLSSLLGGAIAGVVLWWAFPREMTPRNARSPLQSFRRNQSR